MENRDIALLSSIEQITEREIFLLLENFDNIKGIKDADKNRLSEHVGIRKKIIDRIKNEEYDIKLLKRIETLNIKIIPYTSEYYPEKLLRCKPFPPVLYIRGKKELLRQPGVAIVGSRRCSYYGKEIAEKFGRELSLNDEVVFSGMALGIDRYAHIGALNGNGKTVAVLGTGIDIIYPASNRDIYNKITEKGCVISEFPPGTGPFKQNFPFRNRIIAGLSNGVLVVEAAYKSGTFKTVKWALDFGIDVYAIPGDINRITSQGTDLLIREGATPIVSVRDLLGYMGKNQEITKNEETENENESKLDSISKKVYNKINVNSVHFDMLIEQTGLSISELSNIVMNLELLGLVEKLPGNYFRRV